MTYILVAKYAEHTDDKPEVRGPEIVVEGKSAESISCTRYAAKDFDHVFIAIYATTVCQLSTCIFVSELNSSSATFWSDPWIIPSSVNL